MGFCRGGLVMKSEFRLVACLEMDAFVCVPLRSSCTRMRAVPLLGNASLLMKLRSCSLERMVNASTSNGLLARISRVF